MKRYIIYARTASSQHVLYGLSNEYQIRRLEILAKYQDLFVVEIITDVGSNTVLKVSPGFKKLLYKLASGKFDGVICTTIDRLSKDYAVIDRLWAIIVKNDLEIVTPTHTYRNDPQSKMMMDIQIKLIALAKEHHGQSVKKGLEKKRLRCNGCKK